MQQFDKARVFLDEDFTAVDKFTVSSPPVMKTLDMGNLKWFALFGRGVIDLGKLVLVCLQLHRLRQSPCPSGDAARSALTDSKFRVIAYDTSTGTSTQRQCYVLKCVLRVLL